jgi:hypothetical protein
MPQVRFICGQESSTLRVDQGGPPEEGHRSLKSQVVFDCTPAEGGCTPPHTRPRPEERLRDAATQQRNSPQVGAGTHGPRHRGDNPRHYSHAMPGMGDQAAVAMQDAPS